MIRKFLKYSLNAQGFTLAEGMVTAALLGVVSLAMLQGLKEDSKTKAFARINDEVVTIMSSINNNIKDNVSCTASLLGVTPVAKSVPPTTNPPGAVADIKNGDGSILTSSVPQYINKTIAVGQVVAPGLTISTIRAVNFSTYFIMNDDLSDTTSLTPATFRYGSIELEVRFTQSIGQEVSIATERSILVNVKLNDAGSIQSCVNLADLTSLQLKKQICGAKVPGEDGTLVTVGSFVAATGECKGLKESLKSISAQKICTELGGRLGPGPEFECLPVGSGTTCLNGFSEVINGAPKCL